MPGRGLRVDSSHGHHLAGRYCPASGRDAPYRSVWFPVGDEAADIIRHLVLEADVYRVMES